MRSQVWKVRIQRPMQEMKHAYCIVLSVHHLPSARLHLCPSSPDPSDTIMTCVSTAGCCLSIISQVHIQTLFLLSNSLSLVRRPPWWWPLLLFGVSLLGQVCLRLKKSSRACVLLLLSRVRVSRNVSALLVIISLTSYS